MVTPTQCEGKPDCTGEMKNTYLHIIAYYVQFIHSLSMDIWGEVFKNYPAMTGSPLYQKTVSIYFQEKEMC